MGYKSDEQMYMLMVDYWEVPTEYLVKRLEVVKTTPEEDACDNYSDRLCCDVCGANELMDELIRRGVDVGST